MFNQQTVPELLSPCRRQVYDRTGSLADTEELSGDAFDDLYSYYRTMFPKVTDDDIEKVSSLQSRAAI